MNEQNENVDPFIDEYIEPALIFDYIPTQKDFRRLEDIPKGYADGDEVISSITLPPLNPRSRLNVQQRIGDDEVGGDEGGGGVQAGVSTLPAVLNAVGNLLSNTSILSLFGKIAQTALFPPTPEETARANRISTAINTLPNDPFVQRPDENINQFIQRTQSIDPTSADTADANESATSDVDTIGLEDPSEAPAGFGQFGGNISTELGLDIGTGGEDGPGSGGGSDSGGSGDVGGIGVGEDSPGAGIGVKSGGEIKGYQEGSEIQGVADTSMDSVGMGPMGVVNSPEGDMQTGVADDLEMDAEEGAYVLNADAVELIGLKDLNQLTKDAIDIAVESGIPLPKTVDPTKKVPIKISNGEYVLPAILVPIIGLENLEKMNKRGLKYREKKMDAQPPQEDVSPEQANLQNAPPEGIPGQINLKSGGTVADQANKMLQK